MTKARESPRKGLELFPGNRDWVFSLMFLLVLLPIEVNAVTQERCCKENTVGALGSGSSKLILILLTEVIAFHVKLITIDIRWSSLQWLLTRAIKRRSLGFEDRPEDFLQIFVCILSNRRLNSRGVNWGLVIARL